MGTIPEIFIPKILVDLLEDENCEAILQASAIFGHY